MFRELTLYRKISLFHMKPNEHALKKRKWWYLYVGLNYSMYFFTKHIWKKEHSRKTVADWKTDTALTGSRPKSIRLIKSLRCRCLPSYLAIRIKLFTDLSGLLKNFYNQQWMESKHMPLCCVQCLYNVTHLRFIIRNSSISSERGWLIWKKNFLLLISVIQTCF